MCRTGRVFRPEVDGRELRFRVVGAIHYNAILEDTATGSWWYQALGRAEKGPLQGKAMAPVPFEQMTLAAWLALHPDSDVMEPDDASAKGYTMFAFDRFDGRRMKADAAPESEREWVVAVAAAGKTRAYGWRLLEDRRAIEDELGGVPVVVFLHPDGLSFRAYDRRLAGVTLMLEVSGEECATFRDSSTGSSFGFDGIAVDGPLQGQALTPLESTQELWHSLRRFRPDADRYAPR